VVVVFTSALLFQVLAPFHPLVFALSSIPSQTPPPPPGPEAMREAILVLGPVLASWAVAISLLSLRDEAEPPAAQPVGIRFAEGLGVFVVAALIIATLRCIAPGHYALILDEQYYLEQAGALRDGMLARPVPDALVPFFLLRQGYVSHAGIVGQYPVGWPALLALFGWLRLTWWTPVVASATMVFGVYWLAARLAGRSAAVLSALLVLTNALFLHYGATFFGDVAMAAVTIVAMALLVRPGTLPDELPAGPLLAAGLLLGIATAMRPLSGAAMSLGVLAFVWGRQGRLPRLRPLVVLALGTVLPGAATVLYNKGLNGSFLRFGYGMAQGKWMRLGFGERGIVVYHPDGAPHLMTANFSPSVALGQALHLGADTAFAFGPLWLALPLLALLPTILPGRRRLAVLGFAALPFAHLFFRSANVRYLLPLLPFVLVALGLVLAELWRAPRARAAVVLVLVGGLVALSEPYQAGKVYRRMRLPQFERVEQLRQQCGKVLVFVKEPDVDEPLLAQLWWFDRDGFDGDVVVARDLGDRDVELMRERPQHAAFRMVSRGWWAGAPSLETVAGQDGQPRCSMN
jgi:hypothetical protein